MGQDRGEGAGDRIATHAEVAAALGLSRSRVTQLVGAGRLPVGPDGRLRFEAAVAAGRALGEGRAAGELARQRARLVRAQADAAELRLARERGEVLDAAEAARTWAGFCRNLRARLLAIPSRMRQRLPHLTRADVAALDDEIRAALTELGGGA